MDQTPWQHTQDTQQANTNQTPIQNTQTRTRNPNTGRRISVSHSPTMAQTTTQRTHTQRVTRSQTLFATPQLQMNTTASMDIDAGDTSTPIAATHMEVSPGLLPDIQDNRGNEPRSKRRARSQTICSREQQRQDGLPDTQVIDATTQSITCSQNKCRRTSARQTPRQYLITITTDAASTAGTQTLQAKT
jgi:hypothetical protein